MKKLPSVFRIRRKPKIGCGFLSNREIEALIEGRLDAGATDRFDQHQQEGCAECIHLAAAVRNYRQIVEHGVLDSERIAFERTRRTLEARLKQEVERLREGRDGKLLGAARRWGKGLSTRELEQIAAAGEPSPENGGTVNGTSDAEDETDV